MPKLPFQPGRTNALLILSAALLLMACGSTGDKAENGPSDEEFRDNWTVMQESAEFQAAYQRYEQCMAAEGYPETDQRVGVVLKDGTVVKPEAGSRYTLTGAYLEYQVASERCSQSSGVDAVRVSFGTADPTPNPDFLRRKNEQTIKEVACMKGRGWELPEPVTSRGIMIFDKQFASEDERSAYGLDYRKCQAELGTLEAPR